MEEFEDGHTRRRVNERLEVAKAEEHGDDVEPRGGETDGHSAHDGDRDGPLGLRDLFSHMRRAVQTGKHPVGVDQAHEVGQAVGAPSGRVDKRRENELGVLMSGRPSGDRDQNDRKRDERGVERDGCYLGKHLAHAIEKIGEEVDDLVCHDRMPGFGDTANAHKG